jgi:hypothetical protein
MVRTKPLLLALFCGVSALFAMDEDFILPVAPELVATYPMGDGEYQLGKHRGYLEDAPSEAVLSGVLPGNRLIIGDGMNRRSFEIDGKNYSLKPFTPKSSLYYGGFNWYVDAKSGTACVRDLLFSYHLIDLATLSELGKYEIDQEKMMETHQMRPGSPYFYADGVLFLWGFPQEQGESRYTIEFPKKGVPILRMWEDSLTFLEERGGRFTVDGQTVFCDERIVTYDIKSFLGFLGAYGATDRVDPIPFDSWLGEVYYVAWPDFYALKGKAKQYYLYKSDGSFFRIIEYEARFPETLIQFDELGNMWYLDSRDPKVYRLYRFRNTWAPVRVGTLNDGGVRLRREAGTSAEILGKLAKGQQVNVLEIGETKETIGGQTAAWYKVRTKDGLEGWAFGAFINLEK